MKQELSLYEAWDDFMTNVYPSLSLDRNEYQNIYKANTARNGGSKYPLGKDRIKKYLSRHAPDRYEFIETTIVVVTSSDIDGSSEKQ